MVFTRITSAFFYDGRPRFYRAWDDGIDRVWGIGPDRIVAWLNDVPIESENGKVDRVMVVR